MLCTSSAWPASPSASICACARIAIVAGELHLDQFVVIERDGEFGDQGVGDALVADHDDRFQGVGEAAQIAFLTGG